MEMVAPVVIGLLLDSYFGWSWWGVTVGAIVGLIGGLVHLVKLSSPKPPDKPPPPARDSSGK